jgi:hypothetical protein
MLFLVKAENDVKSGVLAAPLLMRGVKLKFGDNIFGEILSDFRIQSF